MLSYIMNQQDFLKIPEKERLSQTLEGIAYYACVHTPNMSGVKKFKSNPYFIVNLALVDKAELEKAKKIGLKVLPADKFIPHPYVKIKRNIKAPKTAEDVKPDVVDSQQNPVADSILIGNGSRVRCKFATYWFETAGGGVGTALYKVQIRTLVAYAAGDKDMVNDSTGYTAPVSSRASVPAKDLAEDDLADDLPWPELDKAAGTDRKAATAKLFD